MAISRREALTFGAAALPLAAFLPAVARGQQPGAKTPGGRDPLLASCLLIGGKRQIEVCQFSLEKLTNDECKAFAKAEIDEHEQMKAKLKEFGFDMPAPQGGAAVPQPSTGTQPGAAVQPIPTLAVGRIVLPGAASEFVQIDKEVHEQCVANFKKNAERKQGVKFDKCFVGDQLHTHQGLLDKVQVFQRHAGADMRVALTEAQQIIEKHLATCEQLMEKLDKMNDNERRNG